MKRIAAAAGIGLIAAAVAVPACIQWVEGGKAPKILRIAYDEMSKALGQPDPESRCYTVVEQPDGVVRIDHIGSRACYDFLPPRRFSGVYVDEFEGQTFLEGAGEAERYVVPCRRVWFTIDDWSDIDAWKGFGAKDRLSRVWLLDFIGRENRPLANGSLGYGHLGASDAEVIVDRVVSARLLGSYQGYSNTGKDDLVTWKEDCPVG